MFKFIFDLLVDPLGLPLDYIQEYLIMIIIGELAYLFAYEKVGSLMARDIVSRGSEAKLAHWIIRFLFYVGMWAAARATIWIYGFVIENIGVSIFAGCCILAIMMTISISKEIEERKQMIAIKARIEQQKVEDKNV